MPLKTITRAKPQRSRKERKEDFSENRPAERERRVDVGGLGKTSARLSPLVLPNKMEGLARIDAGPIQGFLPEAVFVENLWPNPSPLKLKRL